MKKDLLIWVLFLGIIAYLLYMNSCERKDAPKQNTEQIDSLKVENSQLLEVIKDLEKTIDSLDLEAENIIPTIIKGKDRIKILREKVVITDTLVIEYTDAMEEQLKNFDSLTTIQSKSIITLKMEVDTLKKVISNDSLIVGLQDKFIAQLENDNKKKDRKIKSLKIQRWAIPAVLIISEGILAKMFLN